MKATLRLSYTYDHDQRITGVSTSRDGVIWENDASYKYFAHGPLRRTELGTDLVQGTDYAYTINGWLKGINMPGLNPDEDPGGDGEASTTNELFARDAFGMLLGYHEKDFVKSGSPFDSSTSATSIYHIPNPTYLYNGNISSWACSTDYAVIRFVNGMQRRGPVLYTEIGIRTIPTMATETLKRFTGTIRVLVRWIT